MNENQERLEKLIKEITKKDIMLAIIIESRIKEKYNFTVEELEEIINKVK